MILTLEEKIAELEIELQQSMHYKQHNALARKLRRYRAKLKQKATTPAWYFSFLDPIEGDDWFTQQITEVLENENGKNTVKIETELSRKTCFYQAA